MAGMRCFIHKESKYIAIYHCVCIKVSSVKIEVFIIVLIDAAVDRLNFFLLCVLITKELITREI